MENVTDGWTYFASALYYSSGSQVTLGITSPYTIVFPDEPEPGFITGDVNDDGSVNISDVTALIDYLLGGDDEINAQAADLTEDNDISIADITALIDFLLSSN